MYVCYMVKGINRDSYLSLAVTLVRARAPAQTARSLRRALLHVRVHLLQRARPTRAKEEAGS